MHNQNDFDDPKQNEYDEFKQDLQLVRYEIINNFKRLREDNLRNMFIINTGLEYLVEGLTNRTSAIKSPNNQFLKYKELLNSYQTSSKLEAEATVEKIADSNLEQAVQNTSKPESLQIERPDYRNDMNEIEKIEVSST